MSMNPQIEIKKTVLGNLKANKDNWPVIADATGISIHTLKKIGTGTIKNPGIDHMENLYHYFTGSK